MISGRFALAAPNCVADDFGGEIVALNLNTGFYFSLRDLAGVVWRDLMAGHPVQDIAAAAGAADKELEAKVSGFVERLLDEGLIRPAVDGSVPSELPAAKEVALSGMHGIVFDTFDDMRDLVLTDPIHEVDETAGWPIRREDS